MGERDVVVVVRNDDHSPGCFYFALGGVAIYLLKESRTVHAMACSRGFEPPLPGAAEGRLAAGVGDHGLCPAGGIRDSAPCEPPPQAAA